jgi:hypothetical protein
MIINESSGDLKSPSQQEDEEINEASNLLNKSAFNPRLAPPQSNIIGKFIFSWRKLKESATDFLDSNAEIYNNVTSTVKDLEFNDDDDVFSRHNNVVFSEQNNIISSTNENNSRPDYQTPNSFGKISKEHSFLSFKNMQIKNSLNKGDNLKKSLKLLIPENI